MIKNIQIKDYEHKNKITLEESKEWFINKRWFELLLNLNIFYIKNMWTKPIGQWIEQKIMLDGNNRKQKWNVDT